MSAWSRNGGSTLAVVTNKYAKACATCRTMVAEGAGFAVCGAGSAIWLTYHNSDKCLPPDAQAKINGKAQAAVRTERSLSAAGIVTMPYEADAGPLLRAMPGARFNPDDKTWAVSTAPEHRARVLELAEKLRLTVAPELLAPVTDAATDAARDRALARGAFPFQTAGIEFLSLGGRRLLGDEMGLGKTIQALLAIPDGGRALVVVPASLKYNWRDEAKRWRPDLTVAILAGKGSFRWPAAGELVVLNPEILPDYATKTSEGWFAVDRAAIGDAGIAAAANTILIADEAHLYKSHEAKRSARIRALANVCARAWAMTGTPLLNNPLDLWGMLNSFDLAKEVFGSFTTFLRCFQGSKGRWGGYEFGRPLPEVPERLRRVMLRRLRRDVLPDLPTKTRQYIPVNGLGKALTDRLDEIAGDWADALDDGDLPPFEMFSEIRAELATARIPAMLEMVESYEAQGAPLVVASAHRAPIEALAARPGWAVIYGGIGPEERNDIVRRFQAGELKGVGLTIKAGGVGLTLTAASHMLFVDLDWTPALNLQCEDRICRIGATTAKVSYQILVSDHPLDRRVTELLANKMALIEQAVERLLPAVTPTTPKAPASAPAMVKVETQEEYDARLAAIAAAVTAVTKAQSAVKIAGLAAKLDAKPELTPRRRTALTEALAYMIGRCDGAATLDGEGFSKTDVARSRWLAGYDFATDDTAAYAAMALLRGYHRQLHAAYPEVFA